MNANRTVVLALALSWLWLLGPAAFAQGQGDHQSVEPLSVLEPPPDVPAPAHAATEAVVVELAAQPELGLAGQMLREAEAVRGMLAGGGVLLLLVILGAGALGYLGVARLIRAVSRSGYALQRRLVALRVLATGLIVIWGASVVIRQLLHHAPLLTMTLLVLFVGGALLGLATRLQHALGGIAMVLRGRIREGDRLTAGPITGQVEHAGLLRIQLQRADGSNAYLPTSALDTQTVVISSPSRAQPVELPWRLARPLDASERERIRRIVTLCPYRVPGTGLSLTVEGEDAQRLTVRFQAWSAAAADEAEAWLGRNLVESSS
jgi:small-conductance mechanosensitive channel